MNLSFPELTIEKLCELNKEVVAHNHEVFNVLDKDRLLSALSNQYQPYDCPEKAIAATYKATILNHGFEQGNKRTAVASLFTTIPPKCNWEELYDLTMRIANEGGSQIPVDEIANVLYDLDVNESVGYRNDNEGTGTYPLDAIIGFEMYELGNTDIPETILKNFEVTPEEKKVLEDFIAIQNTDNRHEGEEDKVDENVVNTILNIIHKKYPNANYGLWLCDSEEDVNNYYHGEEGVTAYKIEHEVPISDLGEEGKLYVFDKEVDNYINECYNIDDMKEVKNMNEDSKNLGEDIEIESLIEDLNKKGLPSSNNKPIGYDGVLERLNLPDDDPIFD